MQERTPLETEADKLDLEIFRLSQRLQDSSIKFNLPQLNSLSETLEENRWIVRQYMSLKDRKATAGSLWMSVDTEEG